MNETAKSIGSPALPQVNLLPREFAEKRQMRAVQFSALMAIVVAIVLVVVGYFLALGTRTLAENELESARAEQDAAIAARDGRAPIYEAYREREIQEYSLAQIGYGDIDYAELSAAVLATADEDTAFDSVAFSTPTAFGLSGVSTDPVFGGGVGRIDFTARALSLDGATALIGRLEEVPGVVRVDASSEAYSSEGGGLYWQIEGSAGITDLRFTDRLMPSDGITGLDGEAVSLDESGRGEAAEPAPSPTPSAEPENGEAG